MNEIVVKKDGTITISERDCDIVEKVSNGWRFEDIAKYYDLSRRTIEAHVNRLRSQFDCKTVSQLACEFIRKGLIK